MRCSSGGEIAQYLGDGVFVYFGYPVASEDSAQRAVQAGLATVRAIQALSLPHLQLPQPLQVRVGIHTGLVVVGEMGRGGKREHLALGEAPNLAARLQGLAKPNSVVISAATARLIQGFFACQDLGFHTLIGTFGPCPHVSRLRREQRTESSECRGFCWFNTVGGSGTRGWTVNGTVAARQAGSRAGRVALWRGRYRQVSPPANAQGAPCGRGTGSGGIALFPSPPTQRTLSRD